MPLARALLMLGAIGCSVGPNFVKPEVAMNGDWMAKGDPRLMHKTPVQELWWQSFNDVSLNRLVEMAYRQNLPLQIAGLRILEARAQMGIAVGQQYPQNPGPVAGGGGTGLYNRSDTGTTNLFFGGFQVGFDAAWEVDIWGKYRRGVGAAKATYFAMVASYGDAIVSLTAEVARTYIVIRTYEALLLLARQNVVVQEEGKRIADSRLRLGATSELDVAQATNLLESTRASIPDLQANLQRVQNALCTLLDQTSGCAPGLITEGGIPLVPAQVAVGVPAELLRRRPDIRAAEFFAVAQCDRIGVAQSELFPSLVLFGSIGTRTVGGVGAPPALAPILNLFGLGSLLYSFGANLFWPILNYPKILDNVRVQDARLQQSLLDYRYTVLRAAQEVEDGIAGFLRTQESASFEQAAVAAAETAVKLSLTQYREGAVDYQRVLDAERALLQSQNRLAGTRSLIVTNLIALYKALGGGWEVRQGGRIVTEGTQAEMQKRTNWGSYFSKPPEQPR